VVSAPGAGASALRNTAPAVSGTTPWAPPVPAQPLSSRTSVLQLAALALGATAGDRREGASLRDAHTQHRRELLWCARRRTRGARACRASRHWKPCNRMGAITLPYPCRCRRPAAGPAGAGRLRRRPGSSGLAVGSRRRPLSPRVGPCGSCGRPGSSGGVGPAERTPGSRTLASASRPALTAPCQCTHLDIQKRPAQAAPARPRGVSVRLMQTHDSGRGPTTPAWLVWQAFTEHHEAQDPRAAGLLLGARFQGRDRPLRGRGRPPWDGREGAPPPPGRAWTPHSPLLRPPRCAGPCPACAALAGCSFHPVHNAVLERALHPDCGRCSGLTPGLHTRRDAGTSCARARLRALSPRPKRRAPPSAATARPPRRRARALSPLAREAASSSARAGTHCMAAVIDPACD